MPCGDRHPDEPRRSDTPRARNGRRWIEYMRAQLRGDTTAVPPVDVAREQRTFDDPDPEF